MEVDNWVELLIQVTGIRANVILQARSTVVMHHERDASAAHVEGSDVILAYGSPASSSCSGIASDQTRRLVLVVRLVVGLK